MPLRFLFSAVRSQLSTGYAYSTSAPSRLCRRTVQGDSVGFYQLPMTPDVLIPVNCIAPTVNVISVTPAMLFHRLPVICYSNHRPTREVLFFIIFRIFFRSVFASPILTGKRERPFLTIQAYTVDPRHRRLTLSAPAA